MPGLKKAELIEGVVFLASSVNLAESRGHSAMAGWIGTYASRHPAVSAHNDGSVRLDFDNQFQPDLFLRRLEGGTARAGEKDILEGPPELVIEVAASSVSRDLFAKKHVYRRAGVREYIVWRVQDGEVDWFELRDGDYVKREPSPDGILESTQFPGLRLNIPALLAGDLAAVLSEVG